MRLLKNKNTGVVMVWTALLSKLDYMEPYEMPAKVMESVQAIPKRKKKGDK